MPVLNLALSHEDPKLNGGIVPLILNEGTRCWEALRFTPRSVYSMYPFWLGWVVSLHSKNEESYANSTANTKRKQISHAWAGRWVDSKADVNVVAEKQICHTAGIRIPYTR
jgi:hypothetical protein